jgi:gamma-glutamylcyclotransferase (GGCT)/AIG2-like uncharacterized protein YtfP
VTNRHLFVYGTLLSSAGHPMGARLGREARLVGPATIQGRLYRIAWYPGVVETPGAEERVHGELYALNSPMASLTWLDAYEGLVPGSPHHGEYVRVERPALLADGTSHTAWVYLYQGKASGLTPIPDGRWLPHSK